MKYKKTPDLKELTNALLEYTRLKQEYGSANPEIYMEEAQVELEKILNKLKRHPIDEKMQLLEPDLLSDIKKLRKDGPRRIWQTLPVEEYRDKLEGAFITRMAGCTLGAPVEFFSVEHMERWAKYTGDTFPPIDYWKMIKFPNDLRYEKGDYIAYTRDGMNKVPVDDDITYTLLGLLILEEYGPDFTTENVAEAWLKYLPYACTAEDIALKNIKIGINAYQAAENNNPYCQWIGADIRSDPFAYTAPGYPEKAAAMAYQDAYLSHRRNGIYGEMFFAATQSAAFSVNHPVKAIEIGLTEIPSQCMLYKDISWALEVGNKVKNYRDARKMVQERFDTMSDAHTNNNACLTVFGLLLGGTDVTKVLSETVAMGLDNDCTTATAGSIVGAIVGKNNIPEHWYQNFNNTVDTYLTGVGEMKIDDVLRRYEKIAKEIMG